MFELSHGLVLGYHGCDQKVADDLVAGRPFKTSQNSYDWLGHGIYFWESNPRRGLSFARELAHHATRGRSVKSPAVVGAVLNLGHSLDLLTERGIDFVQSGYKAADAILASEQEAPRPQNSKDLLRRHLDCFVINTIHALRKQGGLPPFDSVRGVFEEGEPVYEGAGFRAKTHIQIAIRDPQCILGVFRVPSEQLE